MSKLIVMLMFMVGCASLERSADDHLPPPDTQEETPPDAGVPPTDVPSDETPPDSCQPPPPSCDCDDDCYYGSKCSHGYCYKQCDCDDDCSGPYNQSCDNGLCKGH